MNKNFFRFEGDSYIDEISRIYDGDLTDGVKTVTLQITDSCNLCCTYCYQTNKKENVMSFDTAKKFVDDLLTNKYNNYLQYDNCSGIILDFIGGEPLLQVELIDKIVVYFYQKMIDLNHPWLHYSRISVCSNGTLYFEPKVQDFIRKHNSHLSFTVSIDGDKKLHDSCRVFPDGSGSYDVAMAAAKHYAKHYLNGKVESLNSKMTISPENLPHLTRAVKSLIDIGYKVINLNCTYEAEWNEYDAKLFYNSLKEIGDYLIETNKCFTTKIALFDPFCCTPMEDNEIQNWCGGNGIMLSVDYKGDLYPCIRYMDSSLNGKQEPYLIGNIDRGMMTTDIEKERVKLLQETDRRTSSNDECFYCPIAQGCSWCTAYNYECFGTPKSRCTNICIMHKARSLANAYYWNKVYRLDELENKDNSRFIIHLPKEEALKIIDETEWNMLKELEKPDFE